jgi:Arc/MetJ-type ribon-helix-helix transcriptional regulator
MSHISLRIDTDLDERLDRYAERHHLENRSQAIRHALRAMLNLEEGETVALRPTRSSAHPSMKSKEVERATREGYKTVARRTPKETPTLEKQTAHDRLEAQKIIDQVQGAQERPEPVLAPRDENDEDEGEYFARIQRENAQKAQGVSPDPWRW